MDRDALIRHLRAWAEGVDPADGSTLPADHPAQQTETLRVLFATLALLQAEDQAGSGGGAAPARRTARNAGRPWAAGDDAALLKSFDDGTPVGSLAAQLERTRGAITARLVKLGRIEPPPGLRLRGIGADGIAPPAR